MVAGGSSDIEADIILEKGQEANVRRDDIIIVKDSHGRMFLTKVSTVRGEDETLRTTNYKPGISLVQRGLTPSRAKEFTVAHVVVLGQVGETSLLRNRHVLMPGSTAYVPVEENPMQMIRASEHTIGYYADRPEWRVPAEPEFLTYHVGVFGSTGCGKSMLARFELIPFILHYYPLMILDWKGTDYSPYYPGSIVFQSAQGPMIQFRDRPRSEADIISLTRSQGVLVVDEGRVADPDEKLTLFLRVGRYIRTLINQGVKLNLAILIDEGPQYAPWRATGLQKEVINVLTDLCAMGRSYNLAIILLSQGMAGEIGIDPSVRRNLNTQFIGKIHPLDMEEAKKLLGPLGVDIQVMPQLDPGYFYFLGNMNPARIPLLIYFSIP
jgi:hypothetical protein